MRVFGSASLKDNFVSLPRELAEQLISEDGVSEAVFRVSGSVWKTGTTSTVFASWRGSVVAPRAKEKEKLENAVEFSRHFLSAAQLEDGQNVEVSRVSKEEVESAVADVVCVEPLTADDWEMLELNAGYLEQHILSQINVCCVGQVFPLWIFGKHVVKLRVKSVELLRKGASSAFAVMRPDTNFVVAPKMRGAPAARHSGSVSDAATAPPLPATARILYSDFLPVGDDDAQGNCIVVNRNDAASWNWKQGLLICVHNPLHEQQLQQQQQQQQEDGGGSKKQQQQSPVVSKVTVRASAISGMVPPGCVFLSRGVMLAFGILPLSLVHFIPSVASPEKSVTRVELLVMAKTSQTKEAVQKSWEKLLQSDKNAPVCNGSVFVLDGGLMVRVWLKKDSQEGQQQGQQQQQQQPSGSRSSSTTNVGAFSNILQSLNNVAQGIVDDTAIRTAAVAAALPQQAQRRAAPVTKEVPVEFGSFALFGDLEKVAVSVAFNNTHVQQLTETALSQPDVSELVGVQKSFGSVCRHVLFCLQGSAALDSPIPLLAPLGVVAGSSGVGKTALLRSVCRFFSQEQRVYCEFVDCGVFAVEKLSRVKSQLRDAFARAVVNEPSILVFESLHTLAPAEEEEGSGSFRSQQLSFAFSNLLRSLGSTRCCVLATVYDSFEALQPSLYSPHLCGLKCQIDPLSLSARVEFCQKWLVKNRQPLPTASCLDSMGRLTEGFSCGDLSSFLERIENVSDLESIASARKSIVPASLQNIRLHKSNVNFREIGGLEGPKRALQQMLEWPTKYAGIFSKAPIKLPSGALLFGAPGTGKTLLANACATEYNLNFISVNGPELLSKDIGASEQAVREVFRKARSSKPSVVVFDEFDALAPRRGHDSTGVTDRVVNQLLTQLDGVESREGVYVICVSSRPDLIDPALLRPGRLDKLIFLPLPNEAERIDVLRIIASKMEEATSLGPRLDLSDDDLRELSVKTADFNCADLQALVYNSQLIAAHELMESKKASTKEKGKEEADEPQKSAVATTTVSVTYADGSKVPLGIQTELESVFAGDAKPTRSVSAAAKDSNASRSRMIITRTHVWKALSELRPSISEVDRKKYDRIYGSFRESHREADFHTGLQEGVPKQTLM